MGVESTADVQYSRLKKQKVLNKKHFSSSLDNEEDIPSPIEEDTGEVHKWTDQELRIYHSHLNSDPLLVERPVVVLEGLDVVHVEFEIAKLQNMFIQYLYPSQRILNNNNGDSLGLICNVQVNIQECAVYCSNNHRNK